MPRLNNLLLNGKTKSSHSRLMTSTYVLSVHRHTSDIVFYVDDTAIPVADMQDFCISYTMHTKQQINTNAVLVITGDNSPDKIDSALVNNGLASGNVIVLNLSSPDNLSRLDTRFISSITAKYIVFDIGLSHTSILVMSNLLALKNTANMVWNIREDVDKSRPVKKLIHLPRFNRRCELICQAESESIKTVGELLKTTKSLIVSENGKNSLKSMVIKQHTGTETVSVESVAKDGVPLSTRNLMFLDKSAVISDRSKMVYTINSDIWIVENKTLLENTDWLNNEQLASSMPKEAVIAYDGNTQIFKELLLDGVLRLGKDCSVRIFMDYDGAGFKNALLLYSALVDAGINATYYAMPNLEEKISLYGSNKLYLTNERANIFNNVCIEKIVSTSGDAAKVFMADFIYAYNLVNTTQKALEQEAVYITTETLNLPHKRERLKP
jgi:hypothetical protein